MADPWFHFLLGLLATWRIAHLVAYEDGPWDVLVRLRIALGDGFLGHLVDCFDCVSLWVVSSDQITATPYEESDAWFQPATDKSYREASGFPMRDIIKRAEGWTES